MTRKRFLLAAVALSSVTIALLQPQEEAEQAEQTARQHLKRSVKVHPVPPVAVPAAVQSPYREGEVMVKVSDGEALASQWGVRLLRPTGPSGYATLAAPDGMDAIEFERALEAAGYTAQPNAWTVGADDDDDDDDSSDEGSTRPQWHLDEIGSQEVGGVVIAVLDTGVAYETADGDPLAACLDGVDIKKPWDFVNGDATPYDDHQHGTHLSSLILGTSSTSMGVAPGAKLMPVKVLGSDKTGTEQDLIDGIWWAAEEGADIINLSLVFPEGYTPSPALLEAIEYAWDEEVVIIASAGNDGRQDVAWPARHRLVVAVGASELGSGTPLAPYSNRSPAIDVVLYGGNLDEDQNGDGLPDGLVAETIDLNDPTTTRLWSMAGTSQAAALATGAAAVLLDEGIEPHCIASELRELGSGSSQVDSLIKGNSNKAGSFRLTEPEKDDCGTYDRFGVAALAYLADEGDSAATPAIAVTVYDEDVPAAGVYVAGMIHGEESTVVGCTTDSGGECTLYGETVSLSDGAAWTYSVDAVVENDAIYRPGVLLFSTDAVDESLDALAAHSTLASAGVGVYFDGTLDIGDDAVVADSWSLPNTGTGISTAPFGVLGDGPLLDGTVTEDLALPNEAAWWGLQTAKVALVHNSKGSGISTAPFGLLPDLPGWGLPPAASPAPIWLTCEDPLDRTKDLSGVDLEKTPTGDWLEAGGARLSDGDQAAYLLSGTSGWAISAEVVTEGTGAGAEAY